MELTTTEQPKTIEWTDGISQIDLETLTRSVEYSSAKGKLPKSRPIEHHEFIRSIVDNTRHISDSGNLNIVMDPIYVDEKGAMQIMWKQKDLPCPIENLMIQRLITRVNINDPGDTDMNSSIAVSFTEQGISVAFGTNVRICSNFNIFGGNYMTTHGSNKIPFEKMMEVLSLWMVEFHNKRKEDQQRIQYMQQRHIEDGEFERVIGELFTMAVKQNQNLDNGAPMNQTQVADFVRQWNTLKENKETVWDLCNAGTYILKPDRVGDFGKLLPSINGFNDFLIKSFQLN